MVDEEGKKDKFEFDAAGEAVGYISMAQARVLAIQTARNQPGNYGAAFEGVEMFFEVEGEEEDEDYYHVRVSFRPTQNFTGIAGIEEFVIEKSGTIAIRQVVSALNSSSGTSVGTIVQSEIGSSRTRMLLFVGSGILLAVIGGVAFFLSNRGEESIPAAPAPVPAVSALASTLIVPKETAPAVSAPTVAVPTPEKTVQWLLRELRSDQSLVRAPKRILKKHR